MGDKNQKSKDRSSKQHAAKSAATKAAHDLKQAPPAPKVKGK